MTKQHEFKPLAGLWPWFAGALIAYSLASFAMALSNGIGSVQLQAILNGDDSQVDLFDTHQAISGGVYVLALVFCIFQYSRFFYHAMSNLHAAGVPNATAKPHGIIWWNIVPIASLWKPFQGVAQIWRGTMNGDAELGELPIAMRWWWGFWLISNMGSNITFRLSGGFSGEIEDWDLYLVALRIDTVISLIDGVLALLLFTVAKRIHEGQKHGLSAQVASVFD